MDNDGDLKAIGDGLYGMVDVELRPGSGVLSWACELCDFGLESWPLPLFPLNG